MPAAAAAVIQQQKQLVASSIAPSSSSAFRLQERLKMTTGGSKKVCSNPFRIPRHNSTNGLRLVRRPVRERLAHVSFGHHICIECRKRVHIMLKQRHQIKPSSRLSGAGVPDISLSPKTRSNPATAVATVAATTSTTVSEGRQSIGNVSKPELQKTTAAVAPAPTVAPPSLPSPTPVAIIREEKPVVPPPPPPPPLLSKQEDDKKEKNVIFPGSSAETSVIGVEMASATATPAADVVPNLADSSSTVPEYTMSRRSISNRLQVQSQPMEVQLNVPPVKQVCCFCGLSDENELHFGKFYQHQGIVTHYYCLLLSSNMEQKGNDDEGILGFLADDIYKEIKRGKRLVCSYCRKNGATLGCCNVRCKKIFHFPCGLKAGSLHQFFGEFRSYCISHRPRQRIDEKVKLEIQNMSNILCYICYEDVEPSDNNGTMWAPCCKKNAWFHRRCVQQLAMSAGYFFKCPLCNNKREFQTAMLEYGIYIPRQDASWELVPNAFEELLYRHDRCDAQNCLCPKGRSHTSNNAKWELALCRLCGSQGVHIFCGRLKITNPVWECEECITITKKSQETVITTDDSTSNSTTSIIRQEESTTLNITIREYDDDSDSDISVGNESIPHVDNSLHSIPIDIPPVKLRPGPRSFKLQQVENLRKNTDINNTNTNTTSYSQSSNGIIRNNTNFNQNSNISATTSYAPSKTDPADIICLDSDDEAVEIVCESTMRSRGSRSNQFNHSNGPSRSCYSSSFSTTMLQNRVMVLPPLIPINNNPVNNSHHEWQKLSTTPPSKVASPPMLADNDNEDSPFNIIISNVISVPPEFFASVPEPTEQEQEPAQPMTLIAPMESTAPNPLLKRTLPSDEEVNDDCQIVVETPKRARLDGTTTATIQPQINYAGSMLAAEVGTRDAVATIDTTTATTTTAAMTGTSLLSSSSSSSTSLLTGAKQSPNKALTSVAIDGSSTESSALDNSHSWGSNSVTGMQAPILPQSLIPAVPFMMLSTPHQMLVHQMQQQQQQQQQMKLQQNQNAYASLNQIIQTPVMDVGPTLGCNRTVLGHPTAHSSGSSGDGQSSKSRSSSSDRSGLIPDYVHLRELKFKICGNELELAYRSCKIHMKMNGVSSSPSLTDAATSSLMSDSACPYASGSNANPSTSEKSSSKSFSQLRSEDSDEPERHLKSLRPRTHRNFVYEDDNTLLEYPTSANESSQSNMRITRRMSSLPIATTTRLHRIELKENWDPEVSSSNNTFDNADSSDNNNQQQEQSVVISPDAKDTGEKSNQRLLRRSSRIVRHFRSVQNGQMMMNGDSADSNNDSVSPSLKLLQNSSVEQDKHLKNVDMKDLRFVLTDKINGTNNNNNNNLMNSDADLRVSIDLQKIRNLISANPDLFFNTKNNGVKRLCVYRVDDKLRVVLTTGEKKFLTKSQSFGCLADIATDSLTRDRCRSRSLGNLSDIDRNDLLPLTDKKDCTEKKVRRNQLRKTRQFEKHECVR